MAGQSTNVGASELPSVPGLPPSLPEALVNRLRLSWLQFAGCTAFLAALLLGGVLLLEQIPVAQFLGSPIRLLLMGPIEALYIILVYPAMIRSQEAVIRAYRPLLDADDAEFARLIGAGGPARRRQEALATGIGLAFGAFSGLSRHWPSPWMAAYDALWNGLMWAAIGFGILGALSTPPLIKSPQRFPLRIDIFDLAFIGPVSHQSLLASLVFIGGITISVFFIPLSSLLQPANMAVLGILVGIVVLMFFRAMNGMHQVLVATRTRELEYVRRGLSAACASLRAGSAGDPATNQAAELMMVNAWLALEQRVLAVPQWPYRTDTLRTLLLSAMAPIVSMLARLLFAQLPWG